jgi:hypothetical protein
MLLNITQNMGQGRILWDDISNVTQYLSTTVDAKTKLNSVAFSPQANYTDRATAACRRS